MRSRWLAPSRYAEDGRIEIDNDAAERALRTVALGRKNHLFAGSDAGGERAALIHGLIGTAKLNGLDPQAYLAHLIGRINAHPIHRLEALLPWNVASLLAGRSDVSTDHQPAFAGGPVVCSQISRRRQR